MNVLVACEFSGIVRDAFIARGHDAISCDLMESETPGPHWQGDVRGILYEGWDLMIAHPPCTFLANSGYHWVERRPERWGAMEVAARLFRELLEAPIPRTCIENPTPSGAAIERIGCTYNQAIQPYDFGHHESKRTCLWLKNLPPLQPLQRVRNDGGNIIKMSPGPDRQKERSRFFIGIAEAMAEQWGSLSSVISKDSPEGSDH